MKVSFLTKAGIGQGIKTPADISFYAPTARLAFEILSGAMQRCVLLSTGLSVSRAVC